MRPFRFRAQAALQLRRREHDQALAHLARTESALGVARRRADDAERAIQAADAEMRSTLATPTSELQLDWYRSWRVRLRAERDVCERQRHALEVDVREATRLVAQTHRRVKSLEHLHDDALAVWRRGVAEEERKLLDELGTIGFARRKEAV